jgi:competence protein ComGC
MKLSLYEKLLRYDWFYKMAQQFTLMEYLVIMIVIGLIVWV